MFETAILSSGPQTKRVWTTFLGIGGQAFLLTCLVMAPLISPQVLPRVVWTMQLAPPSPPPPPPPLTQGVNVTHVRPTHSFNDIFTGPIKVPDHVTQFIDEPAVPMQSGAYVQGSIGDAGTGIPGGLITSILGAVGRPVAAHPPEPAPAPAPPKSPETTRPPRITRLEMAEPIQRVSPIYPTIARNTRISGKVELMGVLGTDGRIHEVKVLSGHPFLVKAAVDAVLQWVYRPTILNGTPVEVQAPITVNFILN